MRWSGGLSADENFEIVNGVQGFAGVNWMYVDKRYEGFPSGTPSIQPVIPAYNDGNLHLGVKRDRLTVTAFLKNIGNERGVLSAGDFISAGSTVRAPWRESIIAPRTVGLSASEAF